MDIRDIEAFISWRHRINHYVSGPWLYCRLRDLGIAHRVARWLSVRFSIAI